MTKMTEYKYKLNEIIGELPRTRTIEQIVVELEKEGIPERTFFRDKGLRKTETGTIGSDRLMIYSKFFGVTIESLYNYTSKVKPLTDRKMSDVEKKVINKTGLKKQ